MTFRTELIEAGTRASLAAGAESVPTVVAAVLDAMLAHRTTEECPTCGGTTCIDLPPERWVDDGCSADCPDCDETGRIPLPTRLAIVGKQVGWNTSDGIAPIGVDGDDHWQPVFILAPDQPEEES